MSDPEMIAKLLTLSAEGRKVVRTLVDREASKVVQRLPTEYATPEGLERLRGLTDLVDALGLRPTLRNGLVELRHAVGKVMEEEVGSS